MHFSESWWYSKRLAIVLLVTAFFCQDNELLFAKALVARKNGVKILAGAKRGEAVLKELKKGERIESTGRKGMY